VPVFALYLALVYLGGVKVGSHDCKARTVHQQIRTVRVTLPAPRRPDRTLPDVQITAILATEPQPPAGEAPVEWLLLTNLPVETPEQALEKLQWYLCRWQIEICQSWCLRKSLIPYFGVVGFGRSGHVWPKVGARCVARAAAAVLPCRPIRATRHALHG